MIPYPEREINCRFVPFCNGERGVLLWLVGGSGHVDFAMDVNTCSLKITSNAADMEINIIHLTKLLRRLLVVAPRLRVEFDLMVTMLSLLWSDLTIR